MDGYQRWRVPCQRILVECMEPDPAAALATAEEVLGALPADGTPVLLHAEGPAVWAVLREAVHRGLQARIGLEDTVTMPDGSFATGNASLVQAAVGLGAG